jgi:hypothetical protein
MRNNQIAANGIPDEASAVAKREFLQGQKKQGSGPVVWALDFDLAEQNGKSGRNHLRA